MGDVLTWETNSVLGTLLSSLPSEVPVLTSSPSTTSRGSSPTTLGSTSGSGVQRAWPSSSYSSTSCWAVGTRSTGTPCLPTGPSSASSWPPSWSLSSSSSSSPRNSAERDSALTLVLFTEVERTNTRTAW